MRSSLFCAGTPGRARERKAEREAAAALDGLTALARVGVVAARKLTYAEQAAVLVRFAFPTSSSLRIDRVDEVRSQAVEGGLLVEWELLSGSQVATEVSLLPGCPAERLEILLDAGASPRIEVIGGGEEATGAKDEVLNMFVD